MLNNSVQFKFCRDVRSYLPENKQSDIQPFFTIGVPTFNRQELLKETLNSVLAQTFTDFEIIVGNDYISEKLTFDLIGITDPRIRIINHPLNLREVGNMNALLELASGRYFTWLFDDDLYEPDFLQTAHDCIEKAGFPPAFFSSFRMLRVGEKFEPRKVNYNFKVELTGRDFLNRYSARHPEIASTCGLFDTAALRSIVGGVEELSESTYGYHCEYLFLAKCALLNRIVYVDAPFYVFRRHANSASESTLDLENYLIAGQELIRRCAVILRYPTLVDHFSKNLIKFSVIHIITFAYLSSRFEFEHNYFGICTFYRALSRHWKESLRTKELYVNQGGDNTYRSSLEFIKVNIFCWYLIVRLLAHYFNKSLRQRKWTPPSKTL